MGTDEKPSFVFRDGMLADKDYIEWLKDIKNRFRQSQIKASVRVNNAMLEFYWSVGSALVRMRAEQKWGSRHTREVWVEYGWSEGTTDLRYGRRDEKEISNCRITK